MPSTEPIRVEAPTGASAMALVADLSRFGRPDLHPLADGRWEVTLAVEPRCPTPTILRAVHTWLCVWDAGDTTVHISGRPRLLCRDAG